MNGHLHEGAYYAWRPDQLLEALGAEDGAWAAEVFGVTAEGTFEHGAPRCSCWPIPTTRRGWRRSVTDCGGPRAERVPAGSRRQGGGGLERLAGRLPGAAAMVFDRPDWLVAAVEAAEAVWRRHWRDGRLRRASRDGRPGSAPGIAEDYAALAQAAVRLATATGDAVWLDRARSLVAVILDQFDDDGAGFFDTAADAETLYTRPQDPTDNATPSGLSAALHALRLLAELTGETEYADRADRAAASVGGLASQAPRFAGWLLADAISALPAHAPVQVAVVGPEGPERGALVRAAWRRAPAGSVVLAGVPDHPGFALLADRPMREGKATAYVCRGFVCRLPVTSVDALIEEFPRTGRADPRCLLQCRLCSTLDRGPTRPVARPVRLPWQPDSYFRMWGAGYGYRRAAAAGAERVELAGRRVARPDRERPAHPVECPAHGDGDAERGARRSRGSGGDAKGQCRRSGRRHCGVPDPPFRHPGGPAFPGGGRS